jgi:hypothetical protein
MPDDVFHDISPLHGGVDLTKVASPEQLADALLKRQAPAGRDWMIAVII